MTGPLAHFMPVIATGRHRNVSGDPYFDYVSISTEFRGRPVGYNGPATEFMNIPRDHASDLPIYIAGTPHRFALVDPDSITPKDDGVSDIAAMMMDPGSTGSGMVIDEVGSMDLADSDFAIEVKVAGTKKSAQYICGRWTAGGNGWMIEYYLATKRLRFVFTCNGSTTEFSEYPYYRLGSPNDGLSEADFFNGQWHTIRVVRSGMFITLSIDGVDGYKVGNMNNATTPFIHHPTTPLVIGSISSDPGTRDINSGNWKGMIKHFKLDIGGPVVDIDFSEYWSAWWVGNYPQTYSPNGVYYEYGGLQYEHLNDKGLIKDFDYVGMYWPYDAELNLQGSDFTIELFDVTMAFRDTRIQHIFGMGWSSDKCWRFVLQNSGGNGSPGQLLFQYSLDGTNVISHVILNGLISNAVFTGALAVSRVGSDLRIYWDGVRKVQTTISGALHDCSAAGVRLGAYAEFKNGNTALDLTQIMAFRITKGIGRYRTPTYRVPVLPLPKATT